MDKLRESAMAALEARDELSQVLLEAIGTGGWIPTPLQQSFRLALADEVRSAEALRAALAEQAPAKVTLTDEQAEISNLRLALQWYADGLHFDKSSMDKLREAAESALGALLYHTEQTRPIHSTNAAISALRAAMAEPAPAKVTLTDEQAEISNLRLALQWYADGLHFDKSSPDAWDTLSFDPQNWWCDEAGTATVEDGTLARKVLEGALTGQQLHDDDYDGIGAAP